MSELLDVAWMDGSIVRLTEARVSVLDAGLLYGEGLFETLRVFHGRAVDLARHLERLEGGAQRLGFAERPTAATLIPALDDLITGRLEDGFLRITLTAGPTLGRPFRYLGRSTCFIFGGRLPGDLERHRESGVAVESFVLPSRFTDELKTTSYLGPLIARRNALGRGAFESVLLTEDGFVREGASSTVFIVEESAVVTPPLEGILPGVTRRRVLELAPAEGFEVREERVSIERLRQADEVGIANSLVGLLEVVSVDGRPIGRDRRGSMIRGLHDTYVRWMSTQGQPEE